MTIPSFTKGETLFASELNTALSDTAAQAVSGSVTAVQANANTFTEPQTFEGAITQVAGAGANNESPFAQYGDFLSDFIIEGLSVPVPSPASLTATLSTGTAVVLGQRTVVDSIPNATNTYAASSDTYVSLSQSGIVTYTAVANGATAPAPASDAANILKVVTSSTNITAVIPLVATTGLSNGDGSLVGYNQGSSGAVQRTLQLRLQDSVSVLDFGADHTGASDSSSAFIAAIASGKSIYVPSGDFSISESLSVIADIDIYGEGNLSKITFTGSGGFSITNYAHFTFRNLVFVCDGSASAIYSNYPLTSAPTPAFIIDGCHFYNGANCSVNQIVSLENARESIVSNCVFNASYNVLTGLYIYNECINILVSNCIFANNFTFAGISVNGNNSSVGCQGIDIVNCIMIGGNAGLYIGNGVDWLSCVNTQIDNVASPLIIYPGCQSLLFTNCEFGASTQDGIASASVVQIAGSGAINGLSFVNCSLTQYEGTDYLISNNSGSGITINGFSVISCLFGSAIACQNQMPSPFSFGNIFQGITNNFLTTNEAVTQGNLSSGGISPIFKSISCSNSSTLPGTTSGSITSSMPEQGVAKKFMAYADAYENDTTTAQTITFPTAFTNIPVVTTNTSGLTLTVSTTELTITAPDNTTAYSGLIIVEGF